MHFIDTSLEYVSPDGKFRLRVGALIQHMLNSSRHYDATGAGIRAAVRTESAVRAAHDEKGTPTARFIRIDDPDWKFLCSVLEDPQPMDAWRPYPISPARLLLPLIDAIKAAPEIEPVEQASTARVADTNGAPAQA